METIALDGNPEELKSMAFSPDGWKIAAGTPDGSVKVWEVSDTDAGMPSVATRPDR